MEPLGRVLGQCAPKRRADGGRRADCPQKRKVHASEKQRIDEACCVSSKPITRTGKSCGEIGIVAPYPDVAFPRRPANERSHVRRQFEGCCKILFTRLPIVAAPLVDVAVHDDADAESAVMQRYRPCPSRPVRQCFHGESAGTFDAVKIPVRTRSAKISAHCNVCERDFLMAIFEILSGKQSCLPGRIDDIIKGDATDRSIGAARGGCDGAAVFELHGRDGSAFAHAGPAFARVIEEDCVELRSQHLIAVLVAGEPAKIDVAGGLVALHPEIRAILFDEAVTLHALGGADELQKGNSRREKGFPDVVTRELVFLAKDDVEALASEQRSSHRAGRAAPGNKDTGSFGRHRATFLSRQSRISGRRVFMPYRAIVYQRCHTNNVGEEPRCERIALLQLRSRQANGLARVRGSVGCRVIPCGNTASAGSQESSSRSRPSRWPRRAPTAAWPAPAAVRALPNPGRAFPTRRAGRLCPRPCRVRAR